MKVIYVNLKSIMEEKTPDLSLRDLSEAIHINRETVRRFYNNEMDRYPSELLVKLCDYYDVGINELLIVEDK